MVSSKMFNMALNFQYGWKKCIALWLWFLTGHDPNFCPKSWHLISQNMFVNGTNFCFRISITEWSNSAFILLIFCWRTLYSRLFFQLTLPSMAIYIPNEPISIGKQNIPSSISWVNVKGSFTDLVIWNILLYFRVLLFSTLYYLTVR